MHGVIAAPDKLVPACPHLQVDHGAQPLPSLSPHTSLHTSHHTRPTPCPPHLSPHLTSPPTPRRPLTRNVNGIAAECRARERLPGIDKGEEATGGQGRERHVGAGLQVLEPGGNELLGQRGNKRLHGRESSRERGGSELVTGKRRTQTENCLANHKYQCYGIRYSPQLRQHYRHHYCTECGGLPPRCPLPPSHVSLIPQSPSSQLPDMRYPPPPTLVGYLPPPPPT